MRLSRQSLFCFFLLAFWLPLASPVFAGDSDSSQSSLEALERLKSEVRDLGWIAFCARSDQGDWDIFFARPDGSALRNFTHTPDLNEAAPQFSRDGRRLLFRRLKREEAIDGNNYGMQGTLAIADIGGTDIQTLGGDGDYGWASWSPDGNQIACLTRPGIVFVDIASREVVRRLDRQGFFQQLIWSPDGRWLCGVANNFGTGWSVARMDATTGAANPVSRIDCCTPDWFPDSRRILFSNRPDGQKGNKGYGWTQLWQADAEGRERRLVYGEDKRHVYGGCVSPDGEYLLFTGDWNEDGNPEDRGAPMNLMRLADAPIVGGESQELRKLYPNANSGPVLDLPIGWEPAWTAAELELPKKTGADGEDDSSQETMLARELHDRGWIAFSAKTETGDWDLFRMRPDGSDRSPLTQTPEFTEAGVRFSPDGRSMFYYRMPKDTPLDNNTYGTFTLVLAKADGSEAQVLGEGYSWAAWGPDGDRIAFLNPKGIHILNLADRKVVQTLPRKGFVQQLSWSPDGRWFCATANGLGPYWAVGRIDAQTGALNAASETDRYNCTPDWFSDSNRIVYSRGIVPDRGGWAELWEAAGDGSGRRMLYAEENRHLYGGVFSPDGRYLLFTRSVEDLGKVDHSQTCMAVIRLADTPMIGGPGGTLRARFPEAKSGPCLDLGTGWEPAWTNPDP